jgi:hypothetical protein
MMMCVCVVKVDAINVQGVRILVEWVNRGFEQTRLCAKRHIYGAGVDVR